MENYLAHAIHATKEKRNACAAGSRPDNCAVSLLFMGTSRLPKDSCGHETADKHTKQASFFISARRWLQMPPDMELNRRHAIVWCKVLSSIQHKHTVVPQTSAQQVCAGAFTGLGENGNQDLDPDLQMFID